MFIGKEFIGMGHQVRVYVEEMLHDCRKKVEIIPYPCYPPREGKRKFAEDRLIFFSFGRQPVEEYEAFIEALDGLSSAVFQCLGALVPIVAPNVRYFENLPAGVIVLYEDRKDLMKKIKLLIEDEGFRAEVLERARGYVEENRSPSIL